ncbi:biotin-protein ligase [Pseudoneurospora amorphoporcata]|uniref:Biotin-protein ligase n=1 Tax=Pseudoneurospora amorphoporcata TaxID=241081 RepID=A0AAN6NY41_9PEZI|nr:biotin-protein ligase [Pseudoneurospora amorphoporcata]
MASAPRTDQRVLNVLIYSGPGVTPQSLCQCTDSLKRLVGSKYAVAVINSTILKEEPWASTCALLVFPGGADLPFCRELNGPGNMAIKNYVREGGAYLGFCAGGYYGSAHCWFQLDDPIHDVKGPRELAFFPGTCAGPAFKGFQYHREVGARAAKLSVRKEAFSGVQAPPDVFKSYYNGGGVFVDVEKFASDGVQVLAEYADDIDLESGETRAAVVFCKVGQGKAILTGPHPEFAGASLKPHASIPGYDKLIEEVTADETARLEFLAACLIKLGLSLPSKDAWDDIHRPTNMLNLYCHEGHFEPFVNRLLGRSSAAVATDGSFWLEDRFGLDVFHFEWTSDGAWSTNYDPRQFGKPVYRVNVISNVAGSGVDESRFDYDLYFASLNEFRMLELNRGIKTWKQALGSNGWPNMKLTWGNHLMYGETVTSTNTLLSSNPHLMSRLESGFTFTATRQVAGRGRGTNVWVSPPGCLIMSTVINHASKVIASRPLAFINYLAAIAIVEAIKGYDHTQDIYQKLDVKIKWPNDVYVRDPSKPDEPAYVKVSGILANCSYSAPNYQIIVGIGINTNNAEPTTSLDALLKWTASKLGGDKPCPPQFKIERLVARIITCLEILYDHFLSKGFSDKLEALYYKHWLHTNQIVTLQEEDGVKARVLGITKDQGLLVAEEVMADGTELNSWKRTGTLFQLQSDENGFDYWKGLIKRKPAQVSAQSTEIFEMSPPREMSPPSETSHGSLADDRRPVEELNLDPPEVTVTGLPETPATTPKRGRTPLDMKRVQPVPTIVETSPGGTSRVPHPGYWRDG